MSPPDACDSAETLLLCVFAVSGSSGLVHSKLANSEDVRAVMIFADAAEAGGAEANRVAESALFRMSSSDVAAGSPILEPESLDSPILVLDSDATSVSMLDSELMPETSPDSESGLDSEPVLLLSRDGTEPVTDAETVVSLETEDCTTCGVELGAATLGMLSGVLQVAPILAAMARPDREEVVVGGAFPDSRDTEGVVSGVCPDSKVAVVDGAFPDSRDTEGVVSGACPDSGDAEEVVVDGTCPDSRDPEEVVGGACFDRDGLVVLLF